MDKNKIRKWVALLIAVVVLVATIWIVFFGNLGRVYGDDIIIVSPDKKKQLLIREWGTVGGTGADIYTTNPCLPKFLNCLIKAKVGNTSSDDCCYPFAEGLYDVVWGEDSVTIYYFSGKTQVRSDKSTWSIFQCELK